MSGRFQVVYADPPWGYADSGVRGGVDHHYSTMTLDQICALPVARLAADDCALFMWATWPMLHEALTVIRLWGFEYVNCAFDWIKTTKTNAAAFGLGHWTRGNSEPCLFARRGKPKRADAGVPQVIETELVCAPRGVHSAKPPEVRDRIVRLMGDVPRIEFFARERVEGWHGWGAEYPRTNPIPDVKGATP